MNWQAFELEMTRLTIFIFAVEAIAFIVVCWVMYIVIKSAIRDGINESRLGDRWTAEVQKARWQADREGPPTVPDMPDMRAER